MPTHRKSRKLVPLAAVLCLLAAAFGGYVLAGKRGAETVNLAGAAGGSGQDVTVYACLASGKLTRVSTAGPQTCPANAIPVQWIGQRTVPLSPSPSSSGMPRSASPGASPSASPSPSSGQSSSPSSPPAGPACVTSSPAGSCGAYSYSGVVNSNGYNTYVANNCWADPSCKQTVTASSPGTWSVTSTEPAGNTGVMTYPDVQQLFNDWCGSGWNNCTSMTDTPVSRLSSLTSSFAESMPHNSGTDAEAGYDIWLDGIPSTDSSEIMVWVDNVNRGTGGAKQIGTATIGGKGFTVLQYGGKGGEIIFSLNQSEQSGTVDILGVLNWLISQGYETSSAAIGQIDFGWEICSTGGVPETFSVSNYTLKGA